MLLLVMVDIPYSHGSDGSNEITGTFDRTCKQTVFEIEQAKAEVKPRQ